MNEKALQSKITSKVRSKLSPLLARYDCDFSDLGAVLKWKPIVLILGNYSSGKSTFINELLGREIQRTGQAPTDDSFTVITAPNSGADEGDVPGADLVNDERLPFGHFKTLGEQFISHFRMRKVSVPEFENLALIDSPGMLDSVSEKDRGYDYTAAVKEFAKLADLIVLMFDPHKAGTIQETYNTIRNTLPEATGEDRIIFVMSRIDECDNMGDLVRSYGTLCWNLSQMTGRKDIPRIFLTFSPAMTEITDELAVWAKEREQLKQKVLAAPGLRISHILQNVDRQTQDLKMVAEAMGRLAEGGKKIMARTARNAFGTGILAFLSIDMLCQRLWGFPDEPIISSLMTGIVELPQLIIPVAGFMVVTSCFALFFLKWQLPRYYKKRRSNIDKLVSLDTVYRRNTWERVNGKVHSLLEKPKIRELFAAHAGNMNKLDRFSDKVIQKYYKQVSG